jgi:hypothetical protein
VMKFEGEMPPPLEFLAAETHRYSLNIYVLYTLFRVSAIEQHADIQK